MALSNWADLLDSADDSTDYSPLPEGDYNLVITESELVQSQTGKTGFKTVSEVLDGEYQGRKVFNTMYVSPESPKAMGMFFRQMGALGLDAEYFRAEPGDEQISDDLLGQTFVGTLKHTKSGDKTYANIQNIKPLDDEDVPSEPASRPKAAPKKSSVPAPGNKPARRSPSRKLPSSPANGPV